MSLSDLQLKKMLNKELAKQKTIADRDGLNARISPKGLIVFIYRYRFNGKQKHVKLGQYPNLSLKDARKLIPELQLQVESGLDPSLEKKTAIKRTINGLTLADCFDQFIEAHKGKFTTGTIVTYHSVIKNHILTRPMPIVDRITVQHWFDYFDNFDSPKRAQAVYRKVKSCLSWCYERQLIKRPSILDIRGKTIGQSEEMGERVLTVTEVRLFMDGLLSTKGALPSKLCVLWIALTGCRKNEAQLMEWKDLDLVENVWTIPKGKSKIKRGVRRPITPLLKEVLELLKPAGMEGYVFKGRSGGGCLDQKAIYRKFQAGFGNIKDKLNNVDHIKPHDFRRTLSTLLSEFGFMPHITEKMLGHILQGTMAAYNKHDWLSDQATAYEKWYELIMPLSLSEYVKPSQ